MPIFFKTNFNFNLLLFCLLSFASCKKTVYPAQVEIALDASGVNRSELVKLIAHYNKVESDSLKLKAVYYLLSASVNKYYFDDSVLRNYLQYSRLVKRDIWHGDYIWNSFKYIYGPLKTDSLTKVNPLQTIKADSAIKEIDFTFKVWNSRPWKNKYSFKTFCEYVLPWTILDERPEYNREWIYNQYEPFIEPILKKGGDPVRAAYVINEKLKKDGWGLSFRQSNLPHLGATNIIKYRIGTCREMADLATYIMRALGIPIGNDFVPQWPQRSIGHNWNIIWKNDTDFIMFLGAEDSPGVPHFPGTKKGKIYRNTFAVSPGSLEARRDSGEIIPVFLRSKYLEDVTDKYVRTYTIDVPLTAESKDKHVYLALFNNVTWIPVAWADNKFPKATFQKLEGDIIYLPVYYGKKGVTPAGAAFLLTKDGKYHGLLPDDRNRIKTLTCKKVFPIIPQSYDLNDMIGGKFQGANKADFSDAVDLYTVTPDHKPDTGWNTINLNSPVHYRYVRFTSRIHGYTIGDISEFWLFNKEQRVYGKIISAKVENKTDQFAARNIADNDFSTTFCIDGVGPLDIWVGYDFGKAKDINQIRFVPGIEKSGPDMRVKKDHKYVLLLWNNDQWNLVSQQTATAESITFSNLPSNGLYILHDITAKTDERIFTVNNGITFY